MSVKVEGLKELISNLAKKEEDILRATRKANQAGGELIAEKLRSNVPRSGYSGKNPQPTLADNVVSSNSRTDRGTGLSYVAVGFTKQANFRAHIPEFGSISQGPQGYMSKTIQEVESQLASEMARAIRGVLN